MEASKRERERKTFIETRPLLYFFFGGCFAQFDSRSFTHKHCYVPRTYNTPSAHIVFICILTLYDGVSWKLLGLNRSISRSYITIKWNENQRNKKTNIVVLVLCVRCVRVCFGWFGKKYSTNKKQHQQQQQPTKSHLCVRSLFLFSLSSFEEEEISLFRSLQAIPVYFIWWQHFVWLFLLRCYCFGWLNQKQEQKSSQIKQNKNAMWAAESKNPFAEDHRVRAVDWQKS